MSIPVLNQVYDEVRRLAVAGSVVAPGDFRLKKLVAPLEQAGAKAPVFAKVAESLKSVVDGKEETSATALLDLTSFVTAILYTQGETGLPGALEPIESAELDVAASQMSARVLKPLLEALTTTGSGRLELIRDAFEHGAFQDMRLVKPALAAIDDGYSEVADLIVDKVLPVYGKTILAELRAKLDIKGRAGHPRRLRLMHTLDPEGTREIVKQALESGSKEVKVAAIECLGSQAEDLAFLIEQAGAKAQEVRQAAYMALASVDDDAAVAALHKAMIGKDLGLATAALTKSRNEKLLGLLIDEIEQELVTLPKTKDKKEVSKKVSRLQQLLNCLFGRSDARTEALARNLFTQRDEIARIKGETESGADLNSLVVRLMAEGSPSLQLALAEAHTMLPAEELGSAFEAARKVLPADRGYQTFSPYLTAKVDEKKKQRDPAWAKREALINELGGATRYYSPYALDERPPLDPRWLDIALQLKNVGLIHALGRPGHAGVNAFLADTFAATMKSAKSLDTINQVVATMVKLQHPDATDAFIAAFDKLGKKTGYYHYWYGRIILDLPKSAIPKLEALLSKLSDREADYWLDYIQQLRDKK